MVEGLIENICVNYFVFGPAFLEMTYKDFFLFSALAILVKDIIRKTFVKLYNIWTSDLPEDVVHQCGAALWETFV